MATRRVLRAVLSNFIGTFTIRYSDYNGYWLMGFLVLEPDPLRLDMLGRAPELPGETPTDRAAWLGVVRFREQVAKHGLDLSVIQSAQLVVEKTPTEVEGQVGSHPCSGYQLRVAVHAVTDRGRVYHSEREFFVAPHNPQIERQSAKTS